jgi:ketopantoate reductase
MASDNARILVIGAGVNGSVCAERLFERGVDVTVLARGKRLAEIESNARSLRPSFPQARPPLSALSAVAEGRLRIAA